MSISDTLKRAIEESGLSHRQLADLAKVNRLSIDRLMNGITSISLPQADRIAAVLGLVLVMDAQVKRTERNK